MFVMTGDKSGFAATAKIVRLSARLVGNVKKTAFVVSVAVCTNVMGCFIPLIFGLDYIYRRRGLQDLKPIARFFFVPILEMNNHIMGNKLFLLGGNECVLQGYNLALKTRRYFLLPFLVLCRLNFGNAGSDRFEDAGNTCTARDEGVDVDIHHRGSPCSENRDDWSITDGESKA